MIQITYTFPAALYTVLMFCLVGCNKIDLKEKCCNDSADEQLMADNIYLFVPNIITPNGDAANETFQYYAAYKTSPDTSQVQTPVFAVKKLRVFKLNGLNPVYENNDYNNDFAGKTTKGKELDEGRYRYELTLDSNIMKGNLCIIRSRNICANNCRAGNPQDQALNNMACE